MRSLIIGTLWVVLGTALPYSQDQQALFLEEEDLTRPLHANHETTVSTIRDVLLDNEIIGDVLDDFEPSYSLDISYPKSHESVMLGNDIPVDAVSSRPVFTFHSIESTAIRPRKRGNQQLSPTEQKKTSTFTLILTDPDAKSRDNPKWSEMCHWIMTNLTTPLSLPVKHASTQLFKAQPGELMKYQPPGPPPKTGAHRYVFVLLEGDTTDIKAPADRQHWGYDKPRHGVRDWAKENSLKVVGANFFFAEDEKQ